jgi:hypothetical protein
MKITETAKMTKSEKITKTKKYIIVPYVPLCIYPGLVTGSSQIKKAGRRTSYELS